MPRAATSVATRVSTLELSKLASARSRWPWDLSPCIADDVDALAAQALDQPVGAALGAHEDEREVALAAQLAEQRVDALVALDGDEAVLDRGRAADRRARARGGAASRV